MKRLANFDPVARVYRWAEYFSFGRTLQDARTSFLSRCTNRRSALVLGDGDGRFLAKLLAAAPQLHATAVDTSAGMLALLQTRCVFAGDRLRTVQASALDVQAPADTDLIATHFFLDCLDQSEVDRLVHTLAAAVEPGTFWVVSDFQVPERRVLRPLGRAYIRFLYFAFRVLTGLQVQKLPEIRKPLTQAGFNRTVYREHFFGLIYSELWEKRGT